MDQIWRWLGPASFVAALGGQGCGADLETPPGAAIECETDQDCPDGLRCVTGLNRCGVVGAGDGPQIVGTPVLSPDPAQRTSAISLRFQTDQPLSSEPLVTLLTDPPLAFQLVSELGATETSFEMALSAGTLPHGQWDVRATFFGLDGAVSTNVALGRLTVDGVAPELAGPVVVSPAVAGPLEPVLVTVTADEELSATPSASLQFSDATTAELRLDSVAARVATFSITPTVEAPLIGGLVDLTLEIQDVAGNSSTVSVPGPLVVDATGPVPLSTVTSLRLEPLNGNPQPDLGALGDHARARVVLAFDEPLASPPTLSTEGPGDLPEFRLLLAAGTTYEYELRIDDSVDTSTLASGTYPVTFTAADLLGNVTRDPLGVSIELDLVSPPAPDTGDGSILHVRYPWGLPDADTPAQWLELGANAVTLGQERVLPEIIVYDRADIANAVELARGTVDSDGSLPRLDLPAVDRPEVFVATLDEAGNLMGESATTARRVDYGRWVANLAQKRAGRFAPNPHRILRTQRRDGSFNDFDEVSDYAGVVGRDDSSTLALPSVYTAERFDRGLNAVSGVTPRNLMYASDRDAFLLQTVEPGAAGTASRIYLIDRDGWRRIDGGVDGPDTMSWPGAAYDTRRNTLILFGGTELTPATGPSGFPGLATGSSTWEWDGSWRPGCLGADPCGDSHPGALAAVAYSPATSQVFAVGHSARYVLPSVSSISGVLGSNGWRPLDPAGERVASGLAFDPLTGEGLLLGGTSRFNADPDFDLSDLASLEPVDDTRWWNGTGWDTIDLSPKPPVDQYSTQLVFDERKRVWVLVATPETGTEREVWEFDGTAWSQRAVTGGGPPALEHFGLAYDTKRGEIVYVGAGPSFWALNQDGWRPLNWDSPHASFGGEAFYHPRLRRTVVINPGGVWFFDGESWWWDGPGPVVGNFGATGAYHDALDVFAWFQWGSGIPGNAGNVQVWRRDAACTTPSGYCWRTLPNPNTTHAQFSASYDPVSERIYMYGGAALGIGSESPLGGMFEFGELGEGVCGVGETYCRRAASFSGGPGARANTRMHFDGRGMLLMGGSSRICSFMGGCGTTIVYTDVWRLEGGNFSQVPVTTAPPGSSSLESNRGAFVPGANALFVFGADDTVFRFEDDDFTPIAIEPAFASPGAVAFDRSSGRLMAKRGADTYLVSVSNAERAALAWDLSSVDAPLDGLESVSLSVPVGGAAFTYDVEWYDAEESTWVPVAAAEADASTPLRASLESAQWQAAVLAGGDLVVGIRRRYGSPRSQPLELDYVELTVEYRRQDFGRCGDGLIGVGEPCDPQHPRWLAGGCSSECVVETVCGDGVRQGNELCDDANDDDDDGCTQRCGRDGCCEARVGPGCSNWHSLAVEACVCAVAPECCEVAWTEACVAAVESQGCAACGP